MGLFSVVLLSTGERPRASKASFVEAPVGADGGRFLRRLGHIKSSALYSYQIIFLLTYVVVSLHSSPTHATRRRLAADSSPLSPAPSSSTFLPFFLASHISDSPSAVGSSTTASAPPAFSPPKTVSRVYVPPSVVTVAPHVSHLTFRRLSQVERLRANNTGVEAQAAFKWSQAIELACEPKTYLFLGMSLCANMVSTRCSSPLTLFRCRDA